MDNTAFQLETLAPLNVPAPSDGTEIFVPTGICAKLIRFAVEDNKLTRVAFSGGCDGNLKAISILVEGMEPADVIEKLSGICCGKKSTSCADQLCIALREYMAEN